MCNGNCTCGKTETKGKPASLTSIAFQTGTMLERGRILKTLNDYLNLTRFSTETEGAEENEQWECGFQAAIALIKKGS